MNELKSREKRVEIIRSYKNRAAILSLGLLLVSFFLSTSHSLAAVFNVTNVRELRNALTATGINHQDDTINITPGIYNVSGLTFVSLGENFNLTINGTGIGTTILDGGGSHRVLFVGSSVEIVIKNLTIQNGLSRSYSGGGLEVRNFASLTIENCRFINNSAISSGGFSLNVRGGGALISGSSVTLINNVFIYNSAITSVGTTASGGGAYIAAPGNVKLINNVFINNSADSSPEDASGIGLGGGAFIEVGSGNITNNTFTSNSSGLEGGLGGVGGGLIVSASFGDSSRINIYNNIVRGNIAGGSGNDIFIFQDIGNNGIGAPVNLFNNNFSDFFSGCERNPSCAANINQGNNIDSDPLFVDAANGDVHLRSGSPVINKGTSSAPALPDRDFDGDQRVVGSAPDIGADELVLCAGRSATIHGTPGDDIINGTSGPDVIRGLDGNDTINGLGGNDVICGGSRGDTINGGLDNDLLRGDGGNDVLSGGNGNDTCNGGAPANGDTAIGCETVIDAP